MGRETGQDEEGARASEYTLYSHTIQSDSLCCPPSLSPLTILRALLPPAISSFLFSSPPTCLLVLPKTSQQKTDNTTTTVSSGLASSNMLPRGCRAVPQAVRRTKVQRANARFLSSGRAAPALVQAAKNAKVAAPLKASVASLAKADGGSTSLILLLVPCLLLLTIVSPCLSSHFLCLARSAPSLDTRTSTQSTLGLQLQSNAMQYPSTARSYATQASSAGGNVGQVKAIIGAVVDVEVSRAFP